jgi:hypothetical protein
MKQTAVEWLQECLSLHLSHQEQMQFEGLFQQAKAMEKEQIKEQLKNAFAAGQEQAIAESWLYDDAHPRVEEKAFMTFEQYYNETYNK